MLGTFAKDFSQVATSQGYFPKWQLPKCVISQATLPKSVLAAALGPFPIFGSPPSKNFVHDHLFSLFFSKNINIFLLL